MIIFCYLLRHPFFLAPERWGFVHNLLEGTPTHAGLSALGIIALLGFVACVVTIAHKCVQSKDDDDDSSSSKSASSLSALHGGVGGGAMANNSHAGDLNPNHHQRLKSDISTQEQEVDDALPPRKVKLFKAPGLPYVPAAALICNFSLMAQVSWVLLRVWMDILSRICMRARFTFYFLPLKLKTIYYLDSSNASFHCFVFLFFVLELFKYDVVTHCYLGGLIGLSVAIYAWQRFS